MVQKDVVKRNSCCPESTIDSANRRTFIRRALAVTAAAGAGEMLLDKSRLFLPESSASSSASTITTDTPCSNKVNNLAVFDGKSDITGKVRSSTASLVGHVGFGCGPDSAGALLYVCNCLGAGIVGVGNECGGTGVTGIGCGGVSGLGGCSAGVYGEAGGSGAGVLGVAKQCGPGVQGQSTSGPGMLAISCGGTALKVYNIGNNSDKTARIQVQNGCYPSCTDWYAGVGGTGNPLGLTSGQFFFESQCLPRLVLNKCGNVGIGAIAPRTTLQVNGSVSARTEIISSNYKMGDGDFAVFGNALKNAITVMLPAASNAGMIVNIKKIDTSKNIVTLEARGSDTIEGLPSKSLVSAYDSLMLIAGGNGYWFVLSSEIEHSFGSSASP